MEKNGKGKGNVFEQSKNFGNNLILIPSDGINETNKVFVKNENKDMNMVESFNNYNMNSCTTDGAQVGCVNYIENNKIKPLLSATTQFLQTVSDLSNNNVHLSTSISQYKDISYDLSNNVNAHYWDTTDDHLINPVPTLLDTANSDTNTLMMQQNNMYIAGTMTTATLLILAIMLGST